jgi:hypothetical protein
MESLLEVEKPRQTKNGTWWPRRDGVGKCEWKWTAATVLNAIFSSSGGNNDSTLGIYSLTSIRLTKNSVNFRPRPASKWVYARRAKRSQVRFVTVQRILQET